VGGGAAALALALGLVGVHPARADGPRIVQTCRDESFGLLSWDWGPYRICYYTVTCDGSCVPGLPAEIRGVGN
jgi:hypothetical protein